MTYVNYLRYNVILLKAAGLYEISESKSFVKKIRDYLLRIFFNFVMLSGLITASINIKRNGVLQFSSNALAYAWVGGVFGALQRFIYYCFYDNKSKAIVQKMNQFFKYTTHTLFEEKNMENRVNLANKLTFFWIIYAQVFCLIFSFFPLYSWKNKDRNLPLPLWVPYDWKQTPLYEITYFAQVLTVLVTAYAQTVLDIFFVSIVLLTSEQFQLLGWEFKNLLFTNLIASAVPKEKVYTFKKLFNTNEFTEGREAEEEDFTTLCNVCGSERFSIEMLKKIKKLIEFHQSLLSFCADLEDFFSPLMLVYYLILIFTSLFMNFMIISSRETSTMLSCFPICIAVYIDMFLPCYTANILTLQVEKLQIELYELPWYMCDRKFKTTFKFLLQKVNVPVTFTLGKFADLGLVLFLWGVRTINSSSVILYQLTQPKE